jgi:pimeloyl-ACP methyl ester carboxylesterase
MKSIQSKKIELPNNEVYSYRQYLGGEKVIILVHGNLASSKFFDELIQGLPGEYTAYAIDMRGFGRSTYNRTIDTLRDFAGDLKLFADKLNLENFDLLGWSTGGAVGILFCSSYSYMVNRLFLIDSSGVSGYHFYKVDENGEIYIVDGLLNKVTKFNP